MTHKIESSVAVNIARVKGGRATIDFNASALNKVSKLSVSQRGDEDLGIQVAKDSTYRLRTHIGAHMISSVRTSQVREHAWAQVRAQARTPA